MEDLIINRTKETPQIVFKTTSELLIAGTSLFMIFFKKLTSGWSALKRIYRPQLI
jgi:hypothetical protein